MGVGTSRKMSTYRASKESAQSAQTPRVNSVLVLGTGSQGKTTLVKQFGRYFGGGSSKAIVKTKTSETDKGYAKVPRLNENFATETIQIRTAILNELVHLMRFVHSTQPCLVELKLLLKNTCEKEIVNPSLLTHLSKEEIDLLLTCWADPEVQSVYISRNTGDSGLQLSDALSYFLQRDNLIRVCSKDYEPTFADVLRYRIRTTGLQILPITVPQPVSDSYSATVSNTNSFHSFSSTPHKEVSKRQTWRKLLLLDTGGERSEQRKWPRKTYFGKNQNKELLGLIYVASLSSFNEVLFDDNSTNRLLESLKVFQNTLKSYTRSKTVRGNLLAMFQSSSSTSIATIPTTGELNKRLLSQRNEMPKLKVVLLFTHTDVLKQKLEKAGNKFDFDFFDVAMKKEKNKQSMASLGSISGFFYTKYNPPVKTLKKMMKISEFKKKTKLYGNNSFALHNEIYSKDRTMSTFEGATSIVSDERYDFEVLKRDSLVSVNSKTEMHKQSLYETKVVSDKVDETVVEKFIEELFQKQVPENLKDQIEIYVKKLCLLDENIEDELQDMLSFLL